MLDTSACKQKQFNHENMIATFARGSIDGSVVHSINVDASVVKRRFRPGGGGDGVGVRADVYKELELL